MQAQVLQGHGCQIGHGTADSHRPGSEAAASPLEHLAQGGHAKHPIACRQGHQKRRSRFPGEEHPSLHLRDRPVQFVLTQDERPAGLRDLPVPGSKVERVLPSDQRMPFRIARGKGCADPQIDPRLIQQGYAAEGGQGDLCHPFGYYVEQPLEIEG